MSLAAKNLPGSHWFDRWSPQHVPISSSPAWQHSWKVSLFNLLLFSLSTHIYLISRYTDFLIIVFIWFWFIYAFIIYTQLNLRNLSASSWWKWKWKGLDTSCISMSCFACDIHKFYHPIIQHYNLLCSELQNSMKTCKSEIKPVWKQILSSFCDLFIFLIFFFHNTIPLKRKMFFLCLFYLDRELRRHLSLCMISKLLDGNCKYKPVEREFQVIGLTCNLGSFL